MHASDRHTAVPLRVSLAGITLLCFVHLKLLSFFQSRFYVRWTVPRRVRCAVLHSGRVCVSCCPRCVRSLCAVASFAVPGHSGPTAQWGCRASAAQPSGATSQRREAHPTHTAAHKQRRTTQTPSDRRATAPEQQHTQCAARGATHPARLSHGPAHKHAAPAPTMHRDSTQGRTRWMSIKPVGR